MPPGEARWIVVGRTATRSANRPNFRGGQESEERCGNFSMSKTGGDAGAPGETALHRRATNQREFEDGFVYLLSMNSRDRPSLAEPGS